MNKKWKWIVPGIIGMNGNELKYFNGHVWVGFAYVDDGRISFHCDAENKLKPKRDEKELQEFLKKLFAKSDAPYQGYPQTPASELVEEVSYEIRKHKIDLDSGIRCVEELDKLYLKTFEKYPLEAVAHYCALLRVMYEEESGSKKIK